MKIRRFFGKDMREALKLVKDELGSEAVIMSNRKVADGVELVAAYDKEPEAKIQAAPKPSRQNTASDKPVPTLSEIIGDDGPDSLRELLAKQHQANSAAQPAPAQPVGQSADVAEFRRQPVESPQVQPQHSGYQQPTAPQGYSPQREEVAPAMAQQPEVFSADSLLDDSSFGSNPTQVSDSLQNGSSELDSIKEELASLRNVLQFQVANLMEAKQRRQQPIVSFLSQRLQEMGVSTSLAEQLASYAPQDVSEKDAWLYVLKLLANRLHTGNNDILSEQGVIALVGPTGTGKTTTVAKLAARYAQKYGADQVAMITIDTYRIAAYEQLATYGKILGCVVRKAQSTQELADHLFQLRHKRLVLIDTAGFSQRDSRLIKQLNQFQQINHQAIKQYLVLQGNTQYPALQRIVEAYKHIKLEGCIFTKLDECYSLGEVLSIAIENQIPISYVTDGQQVPEDIKIADAKSLVSAAAKLYKKYGLNHTRDNQVVNAARAV